MYPHRPDTGRALSFPGDPVYVADLGMIHPSMGLQPLNDLWLEKLPATGFRGSPTSNHKGIMMDAAKWRTLHKWLQSLHCLARYGDQPSAAEVITSLTTDTSYLATGFGRITQSRTITELTIRPDPASEDVQVALPITTGPSSMDLDKFRRYDPRLTEVSARPGPNPDARLHAEKLRRVDSRDQCDSRIRTSLRPCYPLFALAYSPEGVIRG